MNKIKEIMKEQVSLYKNWKTNYGDDYCYDAAFQLFSSLDRGQCQEIMEELIKDEGLFE